MKINNAFTIEADPIVSKCEEKNCKMKSDVNTSCTYNRIHFAVMAIEGAALKMHVSGREMHDRLKAQGLIHNRLLARYDDLHTQSLDWVVTDTVDALRNWEAGL